MTDQPKILAFAGSARSGSFNKMLVKIAADGARKAGARVTYVDLREFPLPIYDADLERADGVPENARNLKSLFTQHDGLLIACPEYNGGITALLKNVIDWASRSLPGERRYACFEGKVAAVVATSTGRFGGVRGLVQLRALLEHMRVMVIPDQQAIPNAADAFAPDGSLKDRKSHEAVESVGAKLAGVISKLKG